MKMTLETFAKKHKLILLKDVRFYYCLVWFKDAFYPGNHWCGGDTEAEAMNNLRKLISGGEIFFNGEMIEVPELC